MELKFDSDDQNIFEGKNNFLPALIAGVASLAGGILMNKSNQKIASENNKFQENMSNTAYQRAMVDMNEAGLNPILAYKTGGASTPSGTVMQMQNPMAGVGQTVDTMMNSALSRKVADQQVKNLLQTNRKLENEGDLLDLKKDEQKILNNVLDHQSRVQIEDSKRNLGKASAINKGALPFWKSVSNFIDEFPTHFQNNFNNAMDLYFKKEKK